MEQAGLGFRRFPATLLFCDVRGFTQFFDQQPPDETFEFVSSVLTRMVRVVTASGGRLSNFNGDGFLAQFSEGPHAINAVNCGIAIRQEVQKINLERHSQKNFAFACGIGINTGLVAGGRIDFSGSPRDLILGDVVNTAARVESLCKFFSVDLLISESTEAEVRGRFPLQAMPPKTLRGKSGEHRTFWVLPTSKPGV
jgi:adenylate cyclase